MKKNTIRIVMLACTLLCTSWAFAQDNSAARNADAEDEVSLDSVYAAPSPPPAPYHVSVGIEMGLGNAYLATGGGFNHPVSSWRMGAFIYLPVSGTFCIQPGLFYTTGGGEEMTYGTSGTWTTPVAGSTWSPTPITLTATAVTRRIRSIELSVNAGFHFKRHGRAIRSFIGIGPYVGYITGASQSSSNSSLTSDLNVGEDIRHFDYGLGLNTSIEWRCGLYLRSRVQYGLANLLPPSQTGQLSTFSYGFQFGYLIRKKHVAVHKHSDGYNPIDDRT